jgi:hypothetical protein
MHGMNNKITFYFLLFILCSLFYTFIGTFRTAVKHCHFSNYYEYLWTVFVDMYSDLVNMKGAFWQAELTGSKHCRPKTKDQINASRGFV